MKTRCHACGTEFSVPMNVCTFCAQNFTPLASVEDAKIVWVRVGLCVFILACVAVLKVFR